MSIFRATFYFETSSGDGWSESYYCDKANLSDAQTANASLWNARRALIDDTITLIYSKVHDLSLPRSAAVDGLILGQAGTYTIPSGKNRLPSDVALLVALVGTSALKNHKFLHGVYSSIVDGDDKIAESTWDTAFSGFVTVLIADWQVGTSVSGGIPTVFTPITDAVIERVTERKVGRPFASPRGRRVIRV